MKEVLYIGPGAASWALAVRQRFYPVATVRGAVQDQGVTALVSGQGLPFPDAAFDLVYLAFCLPSIPDERWPGVVAEALRVLQPGGFLQMIEAGWGCGPPAFTLLYDWLCQVLAHEGMVLLTLSHLETALEAAGFAQLQHTAFELPVGSYAGRVGLKAAQLSAQTLERLLPPRLSLLGVNEAEYRQVCEAAQAEWAGHAPLGALWTPPLQPYLSVVGQKPAREGQSRTTGRLARVSTPLHPESGQAPTGRTEGLHQDGAEAVPEVRVRPARALALREFFAGLQAGLPLAASVLPFIVAFGVLARSYGLSLLDCMGIMALMFSGAQLLVMQMLVAGVPVLLIVLANALLLARHLLYSAQLAPYLRRLRLIWRLGFAYLNSDEMWAVGLPHYQRPGNQQQRHWYLLGVGLLIWVADALASLVGYLLGSAVPADWHLEFVATLTFLSLLVMRCTHRANVAAALTAALAAWLASPLPLGLGVLLAPVVGVFAGWLAERIGQERRTGARGIKPRALVRPALRKGGHV